MSLASLRLLINLILTLNFSLLKRNGNHYVQGFMIGLKEKEVTLLWLALVSVREGTNVTKGFYFQTKHTNKGFYFENDVESMHFLEKLCQEFRNESTEISIKNLSKIAERQDLEEVQAIFHSGRYALCQPYKKLSMESLVWHSWSEARHKDHVKRFCQYV